jgi:HD-GYP domain-containing protein (c-di-GMP phosphodiesterase class II)
MNPFNRQAALRIAAVTLLLVVSSAPLAWLIAQERAEEAIVAFAREESQRLLMHYEVITSQGAQARLHAQEAANTLVGGLFEIVELYDEKGIKMAETVTPLGEQIEKHLPSHPMPGMTAPDYQSLKVGKHWILRVFVPLRLGDGPISAYFEGVRVIPEWQHAQIQRDAFTVAFMVSLAALLCGGVLYPVVIRLAADNTAKAAELLNSHIAMMEALGRAIAKRDSDTGAHNYRVAWMAACLGERVGVSGTAMQALIAGSFLHDAGKIGIPDAILLKPGRLDESEMEVMRTHVRLGEEIVSGAGWLDGARQIVSCHHERWDGNGYPRGLKGLDIPLSARIFAIADVFDALCSRRPYKPALPLAQVIEILREGRNTHFDPTLLDEFLILAASLYESLEGSDEIEARKKMEGMVHRHFGFQDQFKTIPTDQSGASFAHPSG